MNAYWISPEGEKYPVRTTHIQEIIENPERFGVTRDYVEKKYDRHNEPLGLEGNAREEIILKFIKEGWIRCRYQDRNSTLWKIQLWHFDDKTRNNLVKWAKHLMAGKKVTSYTELWIHEMSTQKEDRITFRELLEE